jgi:hypothetical protein
MTRVYIKVVSQNNSSDLTILGANAGLAEIELPLHYKLKNIENTKKAKEKFEMEKNYQYQNVSNVNFHSFYRFQQQVMIITLVLCVYNFSYHYNTHVVTQYSNNHM